MQHIWKNLVGTLVPVILLGLLSSSILVFDNNYYTLYYSSPSDRQLSKWAVLHSENDSTIAAATYFRLTEYDTVLYGKRIRTYTTGFGNVTIDDILYDLTTADMVLYTYHMDSVLNRLGNSSHVTVVSALTHYNLVYDDGSGRAYVNLA